MPIARSFPDRHARATGVNPCVFFRDESRSRGRRTGLHPWPYRKSQIGFTVLELLTTLALIVVVMGLMVSLARYVRANSADQVTRRVLLELETQLDAYHRQYDDYPVVDAPADDADEPGVGAFVAAEARRFADALRAAPASIDEPQTTPLDLRDAWGRPIGYLPHHHPAIGMAPQNRPFFVSAGPDGKYLTRQDNLYSYEQTRPTQLPPPPPSGPGVDKANNATGGE